MEHWAGPEGHGVERVRDHTGKDTGSKFTRAQLAELLIIELRHHPHFNNVLTHISKANWGLCETVLCRLLDWNNDASLTDFEANIVSLLCGERGVTGKMMRPWIANQLRHYLTEGEALKLEQTWHGWHNTRMLLPVRFRVSAPRALRTASFNNSGKRHVQPV